MSDSRQPPTVDVQVRAKEVFIRHSLLSVILEMQRETAEAVRRGTFGSALAPDTSAEEWVDRLMDAIGGHFTREDVDLLRRLGADPVSDLQGSQSSGMMAGPREQEIARQRALAQSEPARIPQRDRERLRKLADRLAALLPPREE
jgi:hypothetical protein